MSVLTLRLGLRVFQVNSDELEDVQDIETIRRTQRSPFLIRLGFAAWSDATDALLDDALVLDSVDVPPPPALTTGEVDALQSTLIIVRRQDDVRLLDGLDTDRHLIGCNDERGRRLHARARQSPFLVGLSFAAAVEDRDVLANPTDANCVDL